ncbi:hypothetical protein HPB49_025679 [Dermacentor silvarum]|nr:hypothetical protein HPB49_025679 [Dermacentor silvarum]
MRLRKIIRAAITVAFGRVGVTRRAEAAPPCPGSYAFLTDSRQIVEAFSKANRLLGRDENAFLEDLLEVIDATEVDLFQRAVTSTGTQSALERKVSFTKFTKDFPCVFRHPYGPFGGTGTKILRRFSPFSVGATPPHSYAEPRPSATTETPVSEQAVMSYTVEGEEIDPAELRDGTWQHPKCPADPLDLQKRFGRKKTDPTELTEELGLAGASAASKNKSRPPQLPRRKPMPRLPEEDYKIVLRPKCAVNLTNIGLIALLEAIYATSKINQAQAEQADQVRVHPIKNTITISTPDRTRADAYRTLESLRCEEHNIDIPVSAYVPAPDDSIRGLTPPEQQSRNGRTTTQTREERSGYKISQAAREEGTPTRPQQSKPQQQQDQQALTWHVSRPQIPCICRETMTHLKLRCQSQMLDTRQGDQSDRTASARRG